MGTTRSRYELIYIRQGFILRLTVNRAILPIDHWRSPEERSEVLVRHVCKPECPASGFYEEERKIRCGLRILMKSECKDSRHEVFRSNIPLAQVETKRQQTHTTERPPGHIV